MLMEDEWRAQWRDYDQILAHCLTELDSCDAMLALIWTDEVSNGMQVELEHLQASNKPLFLVIREDLDVWNFRQYAQWIAQYTDDGMYDAVFKVLGM
jgi:nucleoside 2-deoxyribosyltransferase